MRILYVSGETPFTPAGGIATYLDYMVRAMQAAGHEVFLFTWSTQAPFVKVPDVSPFRPENVHLEPVRPSDVWREYPVGCFELAMATYLQPRIARLLEAWNIDVIEATDFMSPALTLFQAIQASAGNERRLCVTYNHGFIEDFYEADQLTVPPEAVENHLNERQQCRISDLVIAPSRTARDRVASYGITGHVEVVREPYRFDTEAQFRNVRHDVTYIGRISISKGIDKLIYFVNAVHPVHTIRQIRLVGRVVQTPFKTTDMQAYVSRRLSPELRGSTFFTGYLSRAAALELLEPGSICPSLGSADTFSYACVETIDRGLLPVVRHGTPMAEFFPEDLKDYVLDAEMGTVRTIQSRFERLLADAAPVLDRVRAYCRETLAPDRIAEQMGRIFEEQLAAKAGRRSHAAARLPAGITDVTVLIPAYKPTEEFMETVDSLLLQTAGVPKVVICDDGTPEDEAEWFDYARAMLPDCRIIRQANSGLLGARNALIETCETRLALFLDSDDLLGPYALERLLEAYNSAPNAPDAVIPQRKNFGESGELVLRNLLDDHLHILSNDFRMTALIRTQVLREIGFDATRRNGEGDDWVFWLKFTGRGYRGLLLPGMEFFYRFRSGSMSWPWSMGQHVGTMAMVRDAVIEMCRNDPAQSVKLARALYSRTVQRGA